MSILSLIKFEPNQSLLYKIIFVISASILFTALIIDYFLGFASCVLCVYQRIPYVIISLICLKVFYTKEEKLILQNSLYIKLILLTLCASFALSLYHTGVERMWWEGTSKCKSELNISRVNNINDFLSELDKVPIGDCRNPAFKIMNFSLAEINMALSLMFFVSLVLYRIKYAKASIHSS